MAHPTPNVAVRISPSPPPPTPHPRAPPRTPLVFWASPTIPKGFEEATALNGVLVLGNTTQDTQEDVATLTQTAVQVPCEDPAQGASTKCEACAGGCQLWSDVANLKVRPLPVCPMTVTRC